MASSSASVSCEAVDEDVELVEADELPLMKSRFVFFFRLSTGALVFDLQNAFVDLTSEKRGTCLLVVWLSEEYLE